MSCACFLPDIALSITAKSSVPLSSDHRIFCLSLKSFLLSLCQPQAYCCRVSFVRAALPPSTDLLKLCTDFCSPTRICNPSAVNLENGSQILDLVGPIHFKKSPFYPITDLTYIYKYHYVLCLSPSHLVSGVLTAIYQKVWMFHHMLSSLFPSSIYISQVDSVVECMSSE